MNTVTVQDIEVADIIKQIELKYGEKIAGWAIIAMVVYLVIAQ